MQPSNTADMDNNRNLVGHNSTLRQRLLLPPRHSMRGALSFDKPFGEPQLTLPDVSGRPILASALSRDNGTVFPVDQRGRVILPYSSS